MKLLSMEGKKKLYYVLILLAVSASMYLFIKYALPVIAPILIAYLIALALNKAAMILHKKLKINNKAAMILVLALAAGIMISILVFLYTKLAEQTQNFIRNFDKIRITVEQFIYSACNKVGEVFDVNGEEIYHTIEFRISCITESLSEDFFQNIIDRTTGIAKGTVNIIVLIVFVFTVIIYMVKNMSSIGKMLEKCYFAKEIRYLKELFRQVFLGYIKAQFVIFVVVGIICTVGLMIIGNPYSIGLGLLISFIDALPLVGICVILLPWTVIAVLQGNYFYGAMLFTMFVLSYMAREYIEPKVMGKELEVNPVLSLIAVYVGYTLFGFFGMIVGPFAFLVIVQFMKNVRIELENV